jgi:hypothetical protein
VYTLVDDAQFFLASLAARLRRLFKVSAKPARVIPVLAAARGE